MKFPSMPTPRFDDVNLEGHTVATNELDPDTNGGFLVPFIAQFVVGRDGISKDEANAWEAEQQELAQRGEFFFACIHFSSPRRAPAEKRDDLAPELG